MVKKPFFSIAIPTYNRASDLQFAIYCILDQSFSDFEIVISDNCSTDNTKEILGKLKDKRIHYYRNKKNISFAQNVKEVVRHAKGEYVFLHGDDDLLIHKNSLKKIHEDIVKYNPGYVRLNYVSLALDKKTIFSFRINKPFKKDEYLEPLLENRKVISFVTQSDPYFITGIIFKNFLPSAGIVDADPYPWINILFYAVKKFGAYFITDPQIVAVWSRRKIDKNTEHHIYSLVNGKLKSENYLNAVKDKLNKKDYSLFLHKELTLHYTRLFSAIKLHVGNKKMLDLARRVRVLDPTMNKSINYWINFIVGLIIPRILLIIARFIYLHQYGRYSKVENYNQLINRLKVLEKGFLSSEENVMKRKGPIFKF